MDLNTARDNLQGFQNVNPADISLAAKSYWEPVVKPLIDEGAGRFNDYFSALPQLLINNPVNTGAYRPETALSNALQGVGRLGSLYNQNLGLRDYYGTRAEDLGRTALDSFKTKYGMATNLYNILFGEKQAADDLAIKKASLAAQYTLANSFKDLPIREEVIPGATTPLAAAAVRAAKAAAAAAAVRAANTAPGSSARSGIPGPGARSFNF